MLDSYVDMTSEELTIDYLYMATTAVLVYDFCLTLHLELKLIWFSRWSYTNVLFILVRYLPLVDSFNILARTEFTMDSERTCSKLLTPLASWVMIATVMLAEIILAIRTWAIWHRNHAIGAMLAIAVISTIIVLSIQTADFTGSLRYTEVYAPACFLIVGAGRNLWGTYTALTLFELLVFVLIAISAFRAYKAGNSGELSNVIHKDGVLFYVYLLGLTVANLIFVLSVPLDMTAAVSQYLETVIYSVLTSRIVLNIREVGRRHEVADADLHNTYHEVTYKSATDIPLRFAPTALIR